MKNALIRLLTIVTLASSLSAFAASNKAKTSGGASAEPTCAPAGQYNGQSDNDQEKSRQRLIREQEEQWLHNLQFPTAG